MKFNPVFSTLLSLVLLITYSSLSSEERLSEKKAAEVERKVNYKAYSQGQKLFLKNCSLCHGKNGEGAKGWRKPDKNGKNLAPPLNGTGHTWHHSTKGLTRTIKNGTGKIGGNMPAWKDTLSDREITLILTWITAQWPDEIYTAWYNRFHSSK